MILKENAAKRLGAMLARRLRSSRLEKKLGKRVPMVDPISFPLKGGGDLLYAGEKVGEFIFSHPQVWTQQTLDRQATFGEPYLLELKKYLPKSFDCYYINTLKLDFDEYKGSWIGSLALQKFLREKIKGPTLIRLQVAAYDLDAKGRTRQADLIRFYENNGFHVDKNNFDMAYMVVKP
jgi:hypothetical protein